MSGRWSILLVVLLTTAPVLATPDLRKVTSAGPLQVYPDDRRAGLYYYPPGDLRVSLDQDGRPELRLFEVRYVGTAAAGDQGEHMFRSLFTFKVVMDGPGLQEIEAARKALKASRRRGSVELRPMPVDRLESALVYAPVVPIDTETEEQLLPEGHFEAEEELGKSTRQAYWTQRTYTVPLDIHSAQLLRIALEEGQVIVSLGYAFFALGVDPDKPLEQLSGSPALVQQIRNRLGESEDSSDDEGQSPGSHLVRAGASSITVDTDRWPELLLRIDINERIPPAYAMLRVYCYDFREGLRPGLYVKRVQIEAHGVSGESVFREVVFERSAPDLYVHSLRFPFAVRLDRPYRYRVIELSEDGSLAEGKWVEVDSWARPLDVTSVPQGEGDEVDES